MCVGAQIAAGQDVGSKTGSDMRRGATKMSSADQKFMMTAATGVMPLPAVYD